MTPAERGRARARAALEVERLRLEYEAENARLEAEDAIEDAKEAARKAQEEREEFEAAHQVAPHLFPRPPLTSWQMIGRCCIIVAPLALVVGGIVSMTTGSEHTGFMVFWALSFVGGLIVVPRLMR